MKSKSAARKGVSGSHSSIHAALLSIKSLIYHSFLVHHHFLPVTVYKPMWTHSSQVLTYDEDVLYSFMASCHHTQRDLQNFRLKSKMFLWAVFLNIFQVFEYCRGAHFSAEKQLTRNCLLPNTAVKMPQTIYSTLFCCQRVSWWSTTVANVSQWVVD